MDPSAVRSAEGGDPYYVYLEVWDDELASANPLDFPAYEPPAPREESLRTGLVERDGHRLVVIESEFANFGGTMGVVAGERVVRAFDRATELGLPVVAFAASGGARLQEGMIALTQMARTASAVHRHRAAGLMYVAVLRPHTTGGVYASWASLADVIAAEPGATIGFGGPRVVAQVTGSFPPPDSHNAAAAFRSGRVDALVDRENQWDWACDVLFGPVGKLELPVGRNSTPRPPRTGLVPGDDWQAVLATRAAGRPSGLEWACWLTDGWVELHSTDPTMRAGIATVGGVAGVGGVRCVVVAMDRHAQGDAAARQWPAGFRLAQRAIGLADRLGLPLLTLIDTPGAEPGPVAEAEGVAGEIARTLLAMAGARVPTVALCVGEGGSGGAMALGHADRFFMLADSVFSVIGPEAGAAILYRDARRAPELARALRLTAEQLLQLGVIDGVAPSDDLEKVRALLIDALQTAQPGERDNRPDLLAQRSLAFDTEHGTERH